MTAKEFIIQKLNECVLGTHNKNPEMIYHIWDKQIIRTKKLLRLAGRNDKKYFKWSKNSFILCTHDYTNKIFWYNHGKLYPILNNKYNLTTENIEKIINNILEDSTISLNKDIIPYGKNWIIL